MTTLHRLLLSSLALLIIAVAFIHAQENASTPSTKGRNLEYYAELAKAPEKARAKKNPLESDSEAVAAGKKLFEKHCGECHGPSAEGGKKGPSLRAKEVQEAAPGTLFWVLTNGVVRRGMPVWSKLPEPQRWQLVSYLKSLGTNEK